MTIEILSKDDLIQLKRTDKKTLFKEKSSKIKFTDGLVHGVLKPSKVGSSSKEVKSKAADPHQSLADKDTLDVKIVCNTAWLCDSHMDVLTDTCYDKSISMKGITIPHIADHNQSSTAHVGDVTRIYTAKIAIDLLGKVSEENKHITALVMESTVRKDYNADVYKFYKNGKINQHSIGLKYEELSLAIDSSDEEDKEEKAVWDEAFPNVLNKELVKERGYFWLVKEIDIIENSCVLFGANSLTPTLEVKAATRATPPISTKVGITMDLEQALAKNLELTSEVAALKADKALSYTKGASEEQARVLGILKSAETLGLNQEVALKRIAAKSSVEDSTSMFTDIAEAIQKAVPVITDTATITSTINKETVPKEEESFIKGFETAMSSLDKAEDGRASWGSL